MFLTVNCGAARKTPGALSAAFWQRAQENVRLSNIRRTLAMEHQSSSDSRTNIPYRVRAALLRRQDHAGSLPSYEYTPRRDVHHLALQEFTIHSATPQSRIQRSSPPSWPGVRMSHFQTLRSHIQLLFCNMAPFGNIQGTVR
jgi:hypothetical protein